MTTYNGLNKNELIEKIAEAKAKVCKAENDKRFGDGIARKNENPTLGRIFTKAIRFIVQNILCLAFLLNINVIAKMFNWRV